MNQNINVQTHTSTSFTEPRSNSGHISITEKFFYGSGSMALALKNVSFNMFVLLFYMQVLGLSGTLTGLAIFVSVMWDAISDPIIGSWSDRLRTRLGRRHPMLIVGTIPLGLSFVMIFSPIEAVQGTQWPLFTWLLVSVILLRTFLTTIVIPHGAMGAEITDDYAERTSIVSYRTNIAWIAGMLLPVIALPVLFPTTNGQDGRFIIDNYIVYGWVCCAIIIIFCFACVGGTWRFIPRLIAVSKRHQPTLGAAGIIHDAIETFGNINFRRLIVLDLSVGATFGINAALFMVTMTYFWEVSVSELAILSTGSLVAAGLIFPATRYFSIRWEKQTILKFAVVGFIINTPWLIVARLTELAPENGTTLLLVLLYLQGTVNTFLSILRTIAHHSILADIADEHELRTGRRQEGVLFSVAAFAEKFVMGFGYIFVGPFLDIIGLEASMAPGMVPETILLSIGIMIGPIMTLILIIPWWMVSRLDVSRERSKQVQAALASKQV